MQHAGLQGLGFGFRILGVWLELAGKGARECF